MISDQELEKYQETLEVVDAHHHFWDLRSPGNWPWIQGPMRRDFFLGDYSSIRRHFTPQEYLTETAGWNVGATVHCEAERDRSEQIAEVEDLISWHDQDKRYPAAAVGHVDFLQANCDEILAQYRASELVRGVRSKPQIAASGSASPAQGRGTLHDEQWLAGLAVLENMGLTYDLRIPYYHLHEAAEVLAPFPNLPVVLNHCGLPLDRDEAGIARWESGMKALSRLENVYVKVSELGIYPNIWDPASNLSVIRKTIDFFGYSRSMFASNLPVALVCAPSFDEVMRVVLTATREAPEEQLMQLLGHTARDFYGLKT